LVTPVPLSPLLLLCCAYGGGSIKILLQAMPYSVFFLSPFPLLKGPKLFFHFLSLQILPSHPSSLSNKFSFLVKFILVHCAALKREPGGGEGGQNLLYTALKTDFYCKNSLRNGFAWFLAVSDEAKFTNFATIDHYTLPPPFPLPCHMLGPGSHDTLCAKDLYNPTYSYLQYIL
jgi:hypothetical protein